MTFQRAYVLAVGFLAGFVASMFLVSALQARELRDTGVPETGACAAQLVCIKRDKAPPGAFEGPCVHWQSMACSASARPAISYRPMTRRT